MTTVTQSPSPNNDFATLVFETHFQRLMELQTEAESAPREPESPLPADDEAVQIDGRDYRVTDRLTVEQLPARVAALWRKDDVVAHVEVRRPRGRCSYIARQYVDGRFSRPWRGSLVAA